MLRAAVVTLLLPLASCASYDVSFADRTPTASCGVKVVEKRAAPQRLSINDTPMFEFTEPLAASLEDRVCRAAPAGQATLEITSTRCGFVSATSASVELAGRLVRPGATAEMLQVVETIPTTAFGVMKPCSEAGSRAVGAMAQEVLSRVR